MKKGAQGEAYVAEKSRICKIKLPDRILWEARLPEGHALVSFDISHDLLVLATNSDQGHRDGELFQPYLTTQVFAVSLKIPSA